ncbi:uncharacterized protein K441DRAFT_662153 [Cenococcum geophilum 1.58]|uniref:uncharacterized protein n=1 Tax=Cenococcum geophilum 1.58 TaxID=794803 RepID=UPI00358E0ED4|nr:hypothetical protein K441DRAFT_662153 [Cenococcum geophilum 1.58]
MTFRMHDVQTQLYKIRYVLKGTFDNFFWPGQLHQVGALKNPPGSTWAHLVANGPPISISTW